MTCEAVYARLITQLGLAQSGTWKSSTTAGEGQR